VTVIRSEIAIPKFKLLNLLLEQVCINGYDRILVTDDDVVLPRHFLDNFIIAQNKCNFALCQPARTDTSWTDHQIVVQRPGLLARETRFVEIFCVRSDLFSTLLPFDETSDMGWGLDFVWPVQVERAGKSMGIIDAVPVDHSLRKRSACYDFEEASRQQKNLLRCQDHFEEGDAFTVLRAYELGTTVGD
jgi:hypothetical protein